MKQSSINLLFAILTTHRLAYTNERGDTIDIVRNYSGRSFAVVMRRVGRTPTLAYLTANYIYENYNISAFSVEPMEQGEYL